MGVRERREKVSQRWREREGKGESEKEREREGGIATPSYLCQFAEKKNFLQAASKTRVFGHFFTNQ